MKKRIILNTSALQWVSEIKEIDFQKKTMGFCTLITFISREMQIERDKKLL